MVYKRRDVQKAIVLALRNLGGSASRDDIKKEISDSKIDGLDYEQVYFRKKTRKGYYSPFLFDFNFGLKNLETVGYVEPLQRRKDIVLTDQGRVANMDNYPSDEQNRKIGEYWDKKNQLRYEKNKHKENKNQIDNSETVDSSDEQDTADDEWKAQLLDQVKSFSPAKFESFSRLLISRI